uniref:WD repeat-containing protein 27 n=1 Tax=Branchiostoma floridae TaxID=7739 RepID=C3XRY5_BRAFL|eukprot:XP_002613444.1 hypothetical protein BRAFLDRAFT_123921 [Branchiostoma floridae]
MSAVLELTIPTVTSPSHTQLSCNGTYLAVPHGKGEVGVWSLQDLGFRQLDLVAHKKAVTATSFGFHSQPTLLCTAAEDYIIVWNIEEARHMYEKGQQIRGQIIGQVLGYVQHVSFSPDDALVAACIGSEILILDSQVERLHSTLEGHNSIVTSAEFCPHHKSTIVSISEDRTFKVWDLENSSLIYQSTIISGPVTVSSRPTWQKPPSQDPVAQDSLTCGDSEASAAVIGLHYCRKLRPRQDAMKHTAPNFLGQDSSLVDNLLDVAPVLIVGTTNALVFINAHTFETTSLLDFEDYIPSMVKDGPSQCNIPLAGSFAFAQGADKQQVWCLVGSLFQKSVDVLRLTVPAPEGLVHELESLSLSSQSVDDGASGEGGTAEISVLSRPGVREFPMESGPPISLQKKLEAAERPTPINSITFSDDGTYLACGLANKSALVLKMPGLTKPHSITVRHAQFYYMDKFILLTCGSAISMFKYHLDPTKDDIKSTIQGSNKSMEVFDMNVARSIRTIPDAHTRPVHAFCQNKGSPFVSHPSSAYDLFLTSALTDGIKLWDLRTNRCVRRYEGHLNRAYPCGLTMSPCARFIATGAEDKSAYIYDVRESGPLHKLTGHTDVVSDVAFHPHTPQMQCDPKLRTNISTQTPFYILKGIIQESV